MLGLFAPDLLRDVIAAAKLHADATSGETPNPLLARVCRRYLDDVIAEHQPTAAEAERQAEHAERQAALAERQAEFARSKKSAQTLALEIVQHGGQWTAKTVMNAMAEQGWVSAARNPMNIVATYLRRFHDASDVPVMRVGYGVYEYRGD